MRMFCQTCNVFYLWWGTGQMPLTHSLWLPISRNFQSCLTLNYDDSLCKISLSGGNLCQSGSFHIFFTNQYYWSVLTWVGYLFIYFNLLPKLICWKGLTQFDDAMAMAKEWYHVLFSWKVTVLYMCESARQQRYASLGGKWKTALPFNFLKKCNQLNSSISIELNYSESSLKNSPLAYHSLNRYRILWSMLQKQYERI